MILSKGTMTHLQPVTVRSHEHLNTAASPSASDDTEVLKHQSDFTVTGVECVARVRCLFLSESLPCSS